MTKVSRIESVIYNKVALTQDDESLIVALGSGGYSMVRPPGRDGWAQYSSEYGLPTFIATVARAIHEDTGAPLETAIPQAVKRVKAWSLGKFGVNVDTQEKAQQALKEWAALLEKVKTKPDTKEVPSVKSSKDRKRSKKQLSKS